jgi:hypothetical protein
MPFTPLHMGPALALKAVAGRRFSVLAFGIAQVAMDIESLVGMLRGADVLHGPTHTYLAAILIAMLVALATPALGRPILRRWNRELELARLDWLVTPESFAPTPILIGAFIGTLSHVALDSLMHADMRPLLPWSSANGLLGLVAIDALETACIAAGVVGALGWIAVGWTRRKTG